MTIETHSPRWRWLIETWLIDGYGVEDIARFLNCHVSYVREYVDKLRADGVLAKWWPV